MNKNYPKVLIFILASLTLSYSFFYYYNQSSFNCASPFTYEGNRVYVDKDSIRVVDGDTIKIDELTIRFLGVDAPEMGQQPYGEQARKLVADTIEAGEVVFFLNTQEYDRYQRLLTYVFVDDQSLSLVLIKNKLAYETVTKYGVGDYPEIANEIKETFEEQSLPDFINPDEWRDQ